MGPASGSLVTRRLSSVAGTLGEDPQPQPPSQSLSDSGGMTGSRPSRVGCNAHLHTQAGLPLTPPTVRARVSAPALLTPKFKGGQILLLRVESTVDGHGVLASTQGLPLV